MEAGLPEDAYDVQRVFVQELVRRGHLELAREVLEETAPMVKGLARAVTLGNLAIIHKNSGDHDHALEIYRQVHAEFERLGDDANTARVLHQIGNTRYLKGDHGGALESYRKSLETSSALGDKAVAGATRIQIANIHYQRGELPEALAAESWDIVTLQQWSQQSYKPETYHPHVDRLIAAIHRYAPRAEILIHETWSYREDHPAFQKQDGFTPDKMYAGLRAAYRQLAGETGCRIIPSGDAFQLARQTPRWTFAVDKNFDFKNPPAGQLPDQRTSLNAGWQWTKDKAGKPALTLDAIHLNTAGRYLGAAVWYQVLFNADTVPAGFTPPDLSAEDAAGLREHAAAAVRDQRSREVALPAR